MRPLPSLVTSTIVPVSATAKLAPLIPMSAARNFSRSCPRAAAVRTSGSAASGSRATAEISSATWPFVLWMAGAMMCDGRSWASWMMYSPRSVSTAVTPACSSASLRSISSVAIDFDFTAMRTPRSRHRRSTISRASSAVLAQCTWPPSRSTLSASRAEVLVQALERRLLDGPRPVPQRLALGEPRERLAAQVDELGRGDTERLLQEAVLERGGGPLGKRRREAGVAHRGGVPASTSARWTACTRPPRRLSPRPSAAGSRRRRPPRSRPPSRSTFASFLSRIAADTSGSRTENEPPKPQHSSAPGSSTSSTPGAPCEQCPG